MLLHVFHGWLTLFFCRRQLCVPGTLIWPFVTWTRSCSCSRPDTPLSSPHRSKVSLTSFHCPETFPAALTVLSSMSVSFSDCLFLLLGDELWWYLSGAAGISCVATCLSSYRSCQSAETHGGLHSVCHRPQRVLSSLSSASTHAWAGTWGSTGDAACIDHIQSGNQ